MDLGTNSDEIRTRLSTKIPIDKKWEILKPEIQKLWIEENQKLSDLIQTIETSYRFSASETQYKYRFKKWGWKKNIPNPKKEEIIKYRQSRAAAGRSTQLEYKGKRVEEKKLRRFLKQNVRASTSIENVGRELRLLTGSEFQLGSSIFLNWNMPYGAMRSLMGRGSSISATSPMSLSTPSDVMIATPPFNSAFSPNNAPSPLTKMKNKRETIDRAYMLIEGRHRDLVNSMRKEEKETMSLWLYQFWLYGFKTAKYWGRGPRTWNADKLQFRKYFVGSPVEIPSTPETTFVNTQFQPKSPGLLGSRNTDTIDKPSPLCRWSIHYFTDIKYESIRSPTPNPEPDTDILDEESWKSWPSSLAQQSCQRVLTRGLASNSFSNIDTEHLPIAVPQIIKASEGSKIEFLEETLGFSIMARNYNMISDIIEKHRGDEAQAKISQLKPVHLAATFLDGYKACCLVVDTLLNQHVNFRASDVDNLGHTIFDKLMMAVLKAHTSITPGAVDDGLRNEKRFPGEETDICGRWDADSDCVRTLLAKGDSCIPFSWKHKFCHTSVQVICHYIENLQVYTLCIEDNSIFKTPSGLFVKRCTLCGLRLNLGALHLLVLTAFNLAQFGAKDEDLFGMLAILLCMLEIGADPRSTAEISVTSLFHEEEVTAPTECDHEELRPLELAERVPTSLVRKWSQKTGEGWDVFCHTLRYSERVVLTDDGESEPYCYDHPDFSSLNSVTHKKISQLYAVVQTEFLTYRRLEERDPWLSPNFDMLEVLKSLQPETEITVALMQNRMMKPLCECGRFDPYVVCPMAEDVMSYHFSNLEDWSRTTFIPGVCLDLTDLY